MTKTADQVIATPPDAYRSTPAKSNEELQVDRTGGKYGAGLIRRASLITRGEALGHREWIDETFLDQVAAAKPSNDVFGFKVRFTHPGLSADGLGRAMGRATNLRRDGNQVFGDIHLMKSASNTPDGNLSEYILDLAEEDPQAFAMSIVFRADRDAADAFHKENLGQDGRFKSPDADNEKNLEHVRLSEFLGADFVDSPAANPGGLFHRGHDIAEEADKLFEYAFGLTDEKPELVQLSADVDRVAAYATKFLESHQLELVHHRERTAPVPAQPGLSAEQIQLLERERVLALVALAESSGLPNPHQVATTWARTGLEVASAKQALTAAMLATNTLTKDVGEAPSDPDAKFRAEYRAQKSSFESMGLTEEEYIASRKMDPA